MKLRVFTTLLLSILFYTVFSQDYKPLLVPGKAWTEIATEFAEGLCLPIFLNEPDTLANIGVAYKITDLFGDEAWLIEDTNAKKVWYYKENSSMTAPGLLYDFSLNAGDTTHIIIDFDYFSTQKIYG